MEQKIIIVPFREIEHHCGKIMPEGCLLKQWFLKWWQEKSI